MVTVKFRIRYFVIEDSNMVSVENLNSEVFIVWYEAFIVKLPVVKVEDPEANA